METQASHTRTSYTTLVVNDASNLVQSSLSGYYNFEGGAGHTNGWISPIPQQWQAALGGKMITGASSGPPNTSRWSIGPSAFSFDLQDFNGANASTPIPTNQLLDFSFDNRLADDLLNTSLSNNLWTQESRVTYGFVVPNTLTYFTIGYSAGHNSGICYKGTPGCADDCPGFCTYEPNDNYCHYWLWDLNDLIGVKNGNLATYDVMPYDYGVFDVPFETETKEIGGGSYDVNTGQLYLSLQRADTLQGTYRNPPLILVYSTNQISTQTPQTNNQTNICVGANYIRVLSTPDNNLFEINGNSTGYTIEILDASLQVYESISGSNSPITINTSNLNLPNGLCYITIKNNSNNLISYKNSFINQ